MKNKYNQIADKLFYFNQCKQKLVKSVASKSQQGNVNIRFWS